MAYAIWNYKINKARSLNASDAINTIYFYDLEVISILHKELESCHNQTSQQLRSGIQPTKPMPCLL